MGNLCVTDKLDERSFGLCPGPGAEDEGSIGMSLRKFDSKYEVDYVNTLGIGAFSQVFLCNLKDSPDETYAVKIINIDAEARGPLQMIYSEIKILQKLGNHPNIMHLDDVYNEVVDEDRREIRMVLELCEGGDLLDRVHAKGFYEEADAIVLVSNIVEAVAYIHSKGIMHRDLKPENVLLTSHESDTDIKISDFGLAKMCKNYPMELPRSRSLCGSDLYLAPEVIQQQEYGREVDIWAVGVVTYGMLCGSLPFLDSDLKKVYHQIVTGQLKFGEPQWTTVSGNARHFIRSVMQLDSAERLTAAEALEHPWLTGDGTAMPGQSFKTNGPTTKVVSPDSSFRSEGSEQPNGFC